MVKTMQWIAAASVTAAWMVFLLAGSSGAQPSGTARPYSIPGHGTLVLEVPEGWRDSVEPPRDLPPTITFRPAEGDAFEVLVTVLWSPRAEAGFNSPQRLRAGVESAGRRALPQAVERALVVEDFRGGAVWGSYFRLTDRAPKPGEYRFMVQGMAGVDDLMLTFTVLYNEPNEPGAAAALDMLKTVRRPAR